jgi:hypothetical protein
MRKKIAEFTGGSGAVKRRILRALSSEKIDLLTDVGQSEEVLTSPLG